MRCKPPVVLPPKAVAPASEAGSRPGSSLSVAESAKGRKATVETGSLRKDPEKVKEIEKPKSEVKEMKMLMVIGVGKSILITSRVCCRCFKDLF